MKTQRASTSEIREAAEPASSAQTPKQMTRTESLPDWVVVHLPHDSTRIPVDVRGQFILDDSALTDELNKITDHRTLDLFARATGGRVVRSDVSRLVVDVERFDDDQQEPMAVIGMGVIYRVTSRLQPLRRTLSEEERASLIATYYAPHHARLTRVVDEALERHGRCLVLDCHSFPSKALPYERINGHGERPDICIGTDPFHTDKTLERAFVGSFAQAGWRVAVNAPFAGAMVPVRHYRRDRRVGAVMVEANRRLYLDEETFKALPDFDQTADLIKRCCASAVALIGG